MCGKALRVARPTRQCRCPAKVVKLTRALIDADGCTFAIVVNSEVTGPKLIKCLSDAEWSSLLLTRSSALRSSNPFRNARATNKGGVGQFC